MKRDIMSELFNIAGSIVVFRNDKAVLDQAITSFLNARLDGYLYVIDNSPSDELKDICARKNVEYIFNNKNLGFGAAHNIALRKMMGKTKYSVILNPDVDFDRGTLEKLYDFMEQYPDVGNVMPKVLYPDGSLQYVSRLLPCPLDMFLRKINIGFLSSLFDEQMNRYELRFADHDRTMDVPYLSGCFMFIRTNIFQKSGIFDERFFLYFEDVDLSRRIHRFSRTSYFPEAVIRHGYERASNKDFSHFKHIVFSAIKYFNKWGWFFDHERKQVNEHTIKVLSRILQ